MTNKSKKAEELFLMGYGCSQSVLGAFAEDLGLDMNTALRIASPFGGGMGRMREVCGAMTGAFMVLGLIYGFDSPSADKKADVYRRVNQIADAFKSKNKTIICRQLLENIKLTKGIAPEERTEDYYKRRPCLAHIIFTTELLEEYIKQNAIYSGDKIVQKLKEVLPEKRLKHTANVVVTALKRAKELNLDEKKVALATTLHDFAKYIDPKTVEGFSLDEDVPPPVIHSFLGAFIAEKYFMIEDEDVINAIRYHTSGRPNMSTLEKLVFVADMVEEGRNYEGVEKLRKSYEEDDFEECFKKCLEEEMLHLINKKQNIYHLTLEAYDFYLK